MPALRRSPLSRLSKKSSDWFEEAKDLVDAAPSVLKEDMKKEDAEKLKKDVEAAGGKVTLK